MKNCSCFIVKWNGSLHSETHPKAFCQSHTRLDIFLFGLVLILFFSWFRSYFVIYVDIPYNQSLFYWACQYFCCSAIDITSYRMGLVITFLAQGCQNWHLNWVILALMGQIWDFLISVSVHFCSGIYANILPTEPLSTP